MKKAYLLFFINIFSVCNWALATGTESFKNDFGKYEKKQYLLNDIENSSAKYQDFINAIKSEEILFREVSPSSVANYMEAFANEGMLGWIPSEYLKYDEIVVALYAVFEDVSNIYNNRNLYEDHFKKIRKENLLNDIENSSANYQDFINAIKSEEILFREVSPSSVANYMEAFANEGMLGWIPSGYLNDSDIKVALGVVLRDPTNIVNNWDLFENQGTGHCCPR